MGTYIAHFKMNYRIHINDVYIGHLRHQNLGFIELRINSPTPLHTISSCCIHTMSFDFPKRRTTTFVESHEEDYLVFGVPDNVIYLALC